MSSAPVATDVSRCRLWTTITTAISFLHFAHSSSSHSHSLPTLFFCVTMSRCELQQAIKIPHASFPHIIDTIVAHSDYKTLLAFRATSSSLKTVADMTLCNHDSAVRLTLEGKPGEDNVVFRNGLGALPFGHREWPSVLKRSKEVQIDGHCLSNTVPTLVIEPGTSLDEGTRQFYSHLLSKHRRYDQLLLLEAGLDQLPRSTAVTVAHDDQHPPLASLPPVDQLTLLADPFCDCSRVESLSPYEHWASRITLIICSSGNNTGANLDERPDCGLISAIFQPSLTHLVISAESCTHIRYLPRALRRGRRKVNKKLQVEFRFRIMPNDVARHDILQRFSLRYGPMLDRMRIVHDPTAGRVWPDVD